jgi:molecular chaperone GrpE (heat shock protein)
MFGRRRAKDDAADQALAALADYASDMLDVLRDLRDELRQINANTTPEVSVRR